MTLPTSPTDAKADDPAPAPLIDIRGLTVDYDADSRRLIGRRRRVRVLHDLNLSIGAGETLGVVGESGSGKTTLLMSLLRLIPATAGEVLFDGLDVLTARRAALKRLRREIQVVFQNPFSSLDPRMSVEDLIGEPLQVHAGMSRQQRRDRVGELLEDVGLPNHYMIAFAHELSGGQAQRVALARALALNPRVILFDEPTSSLDVSVQAQVLNLLMDLRQRYGLTYLFVSHDLGVVRHISDRIVVMYLGEIIERGPASRVFSNGAHPYTQALLSANALSAEGEDRLIRGSVPSFADPPTGCRFHPRCPHAFEPCPTIVPGSTHLSSQHSARCHLLDPASRPQPAVANARDRTPP
jgi:oligopeptide/dipeptide ABC transporter ATP-binding protein